MSYTAPVINCAHVFVSYEECTYEILSIPTPMMGKCFVIAVVVPLVTGVKRKMAVAQCK